jgi:hypothetical protein
MGSSVSHFLDLPFYFILFYLLHLYTGECTYDKSRSAVANLHDERGGNRGAWACHASDYCTSTLGVSTTHGV